MSTESDIVRNAVRCTLCGSSADKYGALYRCQANPCHVGDMFVGIFTDLTYPSEVACKKESE